MRRRRRSHPVGLPDVPQQDLEARARYEALCAGASAQGDDDKETIVFAVYTLDLDEGRGDVYVAAGLGLALAELGYGVRLVDRHHWHRVEHADVFVAMLPHVDPSAAPVGSWRVAWVRNETDRWARQPQTVAYDQVLASSALSARRLEKATPRAGAVLPIGVDTDLFHPPAQETARSATAVTTAHFWGTYRDVHRAMELLPDDADVAWFGQSRGATGELLRWHRESVPYFALPEVYRRAAVVVDDMNATTVGYGSVNSRFFESAACGSLPVVNGLLGSTGLGIEGVPRYRGPEELVDVLARLRDDPAGLAARARAVGEEVRARHSWRVRAQELVTALGEARDEAASAATSPAPRRALHYFPSYGEANPYQPMLYDRLDEVGAYPVPVTDLPGHLRLQNERPGTPGVVHVHWTAPILQWARGPFRAGQVLDGLTADLAEFNARGGRLVWTIHNVLPHDARYGWAEIQLGRLLARHADLVHVMSPATIGAAEEFFDLDPARIATIPHSSYTGRYPDWVSRQAARETLGIHPQEKVLVALGGIRPYKGLDTFLGVFESLCRTDPTLRLLVAGRPSHESGVRDLVQRCQATPRVIGRFEHLPDDQVQVWMRSADLTVLPYHRILNSGAFRLAETFGLPIVAPRLGTLATEAAPHVRLFEPGDLASLAGTVQEAVRDLVADPLGAARAREASYAAAARASPDAMAGAFVEVVADLLDPAPTVRAAR